MRILLVLAAPLLAGCINEEAVRRSGWPQPAPVIVQTQPAPAPARVSCGRMGVWVNCY